LAEPISNQRWRGGECVDMTNAVISRRHESCLLATGLQFRGWPTLRTFVANKEEPILWQAKGHVWTAPSWQGLSSRVQHWSVRPCVRPLSAVYVTAGHNALRGSGPGQKLAFEMLWPMWVVLIAGSTGSALRAVRPPNHHITPDAGVISFKPRVRLVPCSVRPWPSSPTPSWRFCWRARSLRPSWVAASAML